MIDEEIGSLTGGLMAAIMMCHNAEKFVGMQDIDMQGCRMGRGAGVATPTTMQGMGPVMVV